MKKANIFITASIIFLSFMVIFYGSRMIYFYKTNKDSQKLGESYFTTVVKNKSYDKSIKISGKNLYYTGKVLNNYVFYSNRYYRILGIENGLITLVDDNISTILPYDDIEDWLNDTYYDSLLDPDKYLTIAKSCEDCQEKTVNLISLQQYNNASNNGNFLNGNFYWLSDKNYINEKGEVLEDDGGIYGVKAVITLKDDVLYYGGSGTYYDPYFIDIEDAYLFDGTKADKINIGSYIKLGDKIWRVSDMSDNIKLIATESIGDYAFSDSTNIYDIKDKNSIANYLNSTFLNELDKSLLVKGKFNIGTFESTYIDTQKKDITEYVGLTAMGDLFINDNDNHITLTNTGLKNTVYKVVKGKLYADSYKSENAIIPVIYLNKNVKITEGYGTMEMPFGVDLK